MPATRQRAGAAAKRPQPRAGQLHCGACAAARCRRSLLARFQPVVSTLWAPSCNQQMASTWRCRRLKTSAQRPPACRSRSLLPVASVRLRVCRVPAAYLPGV